MNTKIITALVIAFALVGLTGAASAASYTGTVSYDLSQILDTNEPTDIDVNGGACFKTIIDHFDTNYGLEPLVGNYPEGKPYVASPGGIVPVGAGVCNRMSADYDRAYSEGAEHQIATQSGTATITIRSKKTGGVPEAEADITSAQSLLYTGSLSGYHIEVDDCGMAGAYGLLSDGLDFDEEGVDDDCGNIFLKSESHGYGDTVALKGAKVTEGMFSFATYQGMTAELEGVALNEANYDVYGGAAASSTFAGATGDWGAIDTQVYASERAGIHTGWDAMNLEDFCDCPECHVDCP